VVLISSGLTSGGHSLQNIGEYGGLAGAGSGLQSATDWIANSLDQDRGVWIGAAVVIVILLFLFRRK
jgi:hypothetical protein